MGDSLASILISVATQNWVGPIKSTPSLFSPSTLVRRQFGAAADLDDFARRYPGQADELRRLAAGAEASPAGMVGKRDGTRRT